MHVSVRKTLGVVLAATPLVFVSCHADTERGGLRDAGLSARDSTRRVGPGDIRIVSTDSSVEIALIGDTVVTGLAAKALAKVRAETDTGAVAGSGMAANLEKLVKSSVQSALNNELTFPVSSVGDVKYENGTLELFDLSGKRMATFGGSSSDSNAPGGKFSAADAQAFIAVYRAKRAKPA